eukprot:g31510.t1
MINSGAVGIKVLSDIDDTLLCSGGHFPAGCDDRTLGDRAGAGLGVEKSRRRSWTPEDPCCNLALLSARPHVYKEPSGSMVSTAVVARGALFIAAHGWRDVGERKAKMFEQYKALYGEYDFIFFGDNGQGDLLAGQLLVNAEKENMQAQSEDEDSSDGEPAKSFGFCCCRRKKADRTWTWKRGQGPQLKAVMIHEVLPDEQSLSLEPLDQRTVTWRQQLEASGIFFFTSYPDAALKLHQRHPNLISIRQLRSVIEERAGETEELFQQDATSLTRRRTFLRGIQKREETVTEDSEATGSRSDVSVDSWFHTRGWVRAATSIGFDHLGPQPALMRRIGSAWKEIQAMNHNDAL